MPKASALYFFLNQNELEIIPREFGISVEWTRDSDADKVSGDYYCRLFLPFFQTPLVPNSRNK